MRLARPPNRSMFSASFIDVIGSSLRGRRLHVAVLPVVLDVLALPFNEPKSRGGVGVSEGDPSPDDAAGSRRSLEVRRRHSSAPGMDPAALRAGCAMPSSGPARRCGGVAE